MKHPSSEILPSGIERLFCITEGEREIDIVALGKTIVPGTAFPYLARLGQRILFPIGPESEFSES